MKILNQQLHHILSTQLCEYSFHMPKVNWEKKSVAELKAYLKDAGMSGSGDKGTLVWRIGLNEKVDTHKLVVLDGKKPTQLKPAEVWFLNICHK